MIYRNPIDGTWQKNNKIFDLIDVDQLHWSHHLAIALEICDMSELASNWIIVMMIVSMTISSHQGLVPRISHAHPPILHTCDHDNHHRHHHHHHLTIITISPGPCAKNIPCMSSIFGSYPDNPILVWSSSLDQKIIIIMPFYYHIWMTIC